MKLKVKGGDIMDLLIIGVPKEIVDLIDEKKVEEFNEKECKEIIELLKETFNRVREAYNRFIEMLKKRRIAPDIEGEIKMEWRHNLELHFTLRKGVCRIPRTPRENFIKSELKEIQKEMKEQFPLLNIKIVPTARYVIA